MKSDSFVECYVVVLCYNHGEIKIKLIEMKEKKWKK